MADGADAILDVLALSPYTANAPSVPQISLPSQSGHINPSVAIFLARFRKFFKGFSSFALRRRQQWNSVHLAVNIVTVSRRVLASSRATTLTVSVINVCFFCMHGKRFTAFRNANSLVEFVHEYLYQARDHFSSHWEVLYCSWPSTLWPSSKPTRQMSSRRWMRVAVWLLRQSKSSVNIKRQCKNVEDGICVASAPTANELAWFYTGFRQSARPGAFPNVLALCSVEWTYSENKGYESNRRRFLSSVCWTQIISVCQKWPRRCLWTVQSGSRSSRTDRRPPSHPWRPSWSAPEWTCLTARQTRWSTLYCDLISPVSPYPREHAVWLRITFGWTIFHRFLILQIAIIINLI